MGGTVHILCAGAAQGLVKALQPRFLEEAGATIAGRFGAVGAMKEALLAGEPCDLIIVTEAMVEALSKSGELRGQTRTVLGRVRTGVAVRANDPLPDIATPAALRAALLAADGLYFPDPLRATAGLHFTGVLHKLGIHDQLVPRFRSFPNGATAMRELAAATSPRPLGCTQVTEINYTEGLRLVGALPPEFELATVYTAAVGARAAEPALAQHLLALLGGAASQALRVQGGFEI